MEQLKENNLQLRKEIEKLKLENLNLKSKLGILENKSINIRKLTFETKFEHHSQCFESGLIQRYSRQLIMKEFGPERQSKLLKSSALIVGCGGLGSSASLYLAAAGIGKLGLVDFDSVDVSNLHRQIIHNENTVGMKKVVSAKLSIEKLNSAVNVEIFEEQITPENALDLFRKFDLIIDCSDNVATRYLINNTCVKIRKPFISGSAVGCEGQITTYLHNEHSPCYACVFPNPLPLDKISTCSENGVLGVVPGIMGCLQALEAIKILSGLGASFDNNLLMLDSLDGAFHKVKLKKRKNCSVCCSFLNQKRDQNCSPKTYEEKCQNIAILPRTDRITAHDLKKIIEKKEKDPNSELLLIDVREKVQFEICSLSQSQNVPLEDLLNDKFLIPDVPEVYFICRRGNDSQLAVNYYKNNYAGSIICKDVIGGLQHWSKNVDDSFPVY